MMPNDERIKYMKKIRILLPLLLLMLCVCVFTACNIPGNNTPSAPTEKTKIEGIEFPDATYNYDGKTYRSLAIVGSLPEGVSVTYSGNDVMEYGTYTVYAVFHAAAGYEDKYELPAPMSAKLTINYVDLREQIKNIDFLDQTFTYSGEEKFMEIDGVLPEGVHASYEGNSNIDAGAYTVKVTFSFDEGYEKIYKPLSPMTATMTILPASIDLSKLVFSDTSTEHTGEHKILSYKGSIPDILTTYYTYVGEDGVVHDERVEGENFGPTELGSYIFSLNFESSDPNYVTPDARIATLEIVPEAAEVTFVEDGFSDVVVRIQKGSLFPDSKLPNPQTVRKGYTFRWEEFDRTITEDITVRLVAVPVRYTLTFLADDGLTLPEGLPTHYTVEDLPLTLPTVVSETAPYAWKIQGSDAPALSTLPEGTIGDLTLVAVSSGSTTGILYTVGDDGVTVTGYDGTSAYLFLPETYEGKALTSIASDAFRGLPIKYIRMPKTIRNIGNNAFRDCTELRAVDLPSELSNLGSGAFCGCTALTELVLPDSLKTIGSGVLQDTKLTSIKVPFIGSSTTTGAAKGYFGYLFGALSAGQNNLYVPDTLKTVTISKSCTRIESGAFMGLTSLERVVMESDGTLGVRTVSNEAFRGCTALREVEIAATVVEIPANAEVSNSPFFGCSEELVLKFHCTEAEAAENFGQYFATIAEEKTATVVYLTEEA